MKKESFMAFVCLLAFSFLTIPVWAETSGKDVSPSIRVTPPAPRFTDAQRQAELAKRRAEVLKRMSAGSIMILFSAEPRNYTGDVDFLYRQENNLYYLTNIKQNGSTLVLINDGAQTQEILFLPKRNPANETWNGKMYSREDAQKISGLKTILDSSELANFVEAFKGKKPFTSKNDGVSITNTAQTVYLLLDNDTDGAGEFRRENNFSKTLEGYKVENAQTIFADLRLTKSPMEQKLLQHSIDITTEAQMRAMAISNRAKWEYEVQAEVEYTFRRRNADYWGYPSIVGCGPNATTLHYVESQGEVKQSDLILMDVGAEYEHLTADVTRTFPANGKFTKEQAEIYQIVYDAQEAAAKEIKPGAKFSDASRAATEVIKQGLTKLGLITAPEATIQLTFNGQTYSRPQYTLWFMHGWGHWLGMNVHDVGDYGATLQPGMIMTNEPGIYIREDALEYLPKTPDNQAFLAKIKPVFEKYKNIGVRIEDDMLVTQTGVEWMTKNLPRKINEVEAFMAKAQKEVQCSSIFQKNLKPNLTLSGRSENMFLPENQFDILSLIKFPQGKTKRKGWIWTGKKTTQAGFTHAEHSHGE